MLQNPDFELPPANWNASSDALFPLNETNSIAGWTVNGELKYATVGAELSLPRNGHAILLQEDGKINQTFVANGEEMQYLLTFTLARMNHSCSANASLVVSAPDSSAEFSLTFKYGRQPWEVYGHQLGIWGGGESINLVIESQDIDADSNSTCWPVVDDVLLSTIGSLKQGNDGMFLISFTVITPNSELVIASIINSNTQSYTYICSVLQIICCQMEDLSLGQLSQISRMKEFYWIQSQV